MSPTELLTAARRLISHATPATHGLWARAAATLARQAIEARIHDILSERAPGSQATPMRAQLLCLQAVLPDKSLARKLSYAWARLSAATHHHAYELAPSAKELENWMSAVDVSTTPTG